MSELVELLNRAFSSNSVPSERDFVRIAKNDDPGKEYLRKGLLGKSQAEVINLLRSGALGNGSMFTEELELAEPVGVQYYLHPFLVHFATLVQADSRLLDDETPFFLFAHLRNIIEHRGANVFTQAQLMALGTFVDEMLRTIATLPSKDAIWLEDVSQKLHELDNALKTARPSP
jgi:hypothetical protein